MTRKAFKRGKKCLSPLWAARRGVSCGGRSYRGGFTLAELIVAAGVFVVVVTIAVGVFVSAVRNQRLLTELMAVNNNAGGILEQIAREARTGFRFCGSQSSGSPCNLSSDSLSFVNYRGADVTYEFNRDDGTVMRSEGGAPEALTARETEVTYLNFFVAQHNLNGDPSDDVCNPWRITMTMGVRPRNAQLANREVKLQTTVSSRVLPAEAPNAPEEIIEICSR